MTAPGEPVTLLRITPGFSRGNLGGVTVDGDSAKVTIPGHHPDLLAELAEGMADAAALWNPLTRRDESADEGKSRRYHQLAAALREALAAARPGPGPTSG